MALKYNLSKVYALSDNDPEFVNEILKLFVTEVPEDLKQIKEGIKKKESDLWTIESYLLTVVWHSQPVDSQCS